MTELPTNAPEYRLKQRAMDRQSIAAAQFQALRGMLGRILPTNEFYFRKFLKSGLVQADRPADWAWLEDREALARLPITNKAELIAGEQAPFAANLTWQPERYVRFHRTSGTHGHPMVVLDTAADWRWWIASWQHVLDVAGISPSDRALMAFSFGPFIGFWSAFDAVAARGALVIPTGAMTTLARLEMIRSTSATVLFCTPGYALHMAEVAAANGITIADSPVRKIIVAGEPGGSIPATRNRIQSAWNADVVDHCGASEIGPWGFADAKGRGIYVNECDFLPELISIDNGELIPFASIPRQSENARCASAGSGQGGSELAELAELVLTTLGRDGSPVIRYRTGDLVQPVIHTGSQGESQFLYLAGGVLGRTDDMMIIRGVNVFPTSVEAILREVPEVVEYRMTAVKAGQMDQLKIELEASSDVTRSVGELLQARLGLRIEVAQVVDGQLPRFEAKGKRFVDQRGD